MEHEDIDGHKKYIEILKRMTPQQRLAKALELSEFGKQIFIAGLRHRNPDLSEDDFKKLLFEQLEKCHNINY